MEFIRNSYYLDTRINYGPVYVIGPYYQELQTNLKMQHQAEAHTFLPRIASKNGSYALMEIKEQFLDWPIIYPHKKGMWHCGKFVFLCGRLRRRIIPPLHFQLGISSEPAPTKE